MADECHRGDRVYALFDDGLTPYAIVTGLVFALAIVLVGGDLPWRDAGRDPDRS